MQRKTREPRLASLRIWVNNHSIGTGILERRSEGECPALAPAPLPRLSPLRSFFRRRSESFVKRSLKSFGRGGSKKTPLPRNWKLVKEKDGAFGKEKIYYLNSVTNQTSHEPPPPLPNGWKEALHKDSGRVYYYNKVERQLHDPYSQTRPLLPSWLSPWPSP